MNLVTKTYTPCHNRVLIRFVAPSGSNIILPDGKNIGNRTMVEAIGPDVKCCKAGDQVMLSIQPNMVGIDEAEKLVVVLDTDIVAIVG